MDEEEAAAASAAANYYSMLKHQIINRVAFVYMFQTIAQANATI